MSILRRRNMFVVVTLLPCCAAALRGPLTSLRMCELAAASAAASEQHSLANLGAATVIRASLGLDRGLAANSAAATEVQKVVDQFEAVSPCTLEGDSLEAYLEGEWRLVYSSRLAASKSASVRGLTLGDVTQKLMRLHDGGGLQIEDSILLHAHAPWPLQPPPALAITFRCEAQASVTAHAETSSADGGVLLAKLRDVSARMPSLPRGLGSLVTKGATLPVAQAYERLPTVVGQQLRSVSSLHRTLAPLRTLQEGVPWRTTAASETVRVQRDESGAMRVFVRTYVSGTQESASSVAAAAVAAAPAIGPRELMRARKEAAATATAEVERVSTAAAAEIAELKDMLALAAASEAALAEEKVEVARQLEGAQASAAAAAAAAAAELADQVELAEARAAAATAEAEAAIAEVKAAAEAKLSSARAAAQAEQQAMSAAHMEALQQIEAEAARTATAAQQELALAKAAAEEAAAAARVTFAAEKQALTARLNEAEERAAKAKAAAIAAIGDL